jgi:glycosyltransferase involved in cell wall biosynthesis
MKILIVTDAHRPQINGVVNTLENTVAELTRSGHEVKLFRSVKGPAFKIPFTIDVRCPLFIDQKGLCDVLEWSDCVHISTEGRVGFAARAACVKRDFKFSTAFHTDIPSFIEQTIGLGSSLAIRYLRWFHSKSACLMVTTAKNMEALRKQGHKVEMRIWSRGVDTDLFVPMLKESSQRIRLVYCGRVSPEKGLKDFFELDNRYHKTIIGDGVKLKEYAEAHPDVKFTGFLQGRDLANELASHDIFVFPSKFDTFGLVNIEAMSCGLPVACYKGRGAGEIVTNGDGLGCAHDVLAEAVRQCQKLVNNNKAREHVLENYTWQRATAEFVGNLTLKK